MKEQVDERRRTRRAFKDVSLRHWLQAVAERNGASAIVIADGTGLLVAGGIEDDEGERMAATAALQAQEDQDLTVADDRGTTMLIRRFSWQQETLYVCVRGEPERCRAALVEAHDGILRILEEAAPASP